MLVNYTKILPAFIVCKNDLSIFIYKYIYIYIFKSFLRTYIFSIKTLTTKKLLFEFQMKYKKNFKNNIIHSIIYDKKKDSHLKTINLYRQYKKLFK